LAQGNGGGQMARRLCTPHPSEFAAVYLLVALKLRSGAVLAQSPLVHLLSFLRHE